MGTKRIPISAAKGIADAYGQSQVILVSFEKDTGVTHVVTYGKSQLECEQAAAGGNLVKKALGWPESLCNAKPARQKLKEKKECEAALRLYNDWRHNHSGTYSFSTHLNYLLNKDS